MNSVKRRIVRTIYTHGSVIKAVISPSVTHVYGKEKDELQRSGGEKRATPELADETSLTSLDNS